ncbi:MAG: hypothetical protein Q9165_006544 [Trypethelium subeluteriae]
MKKAKTISNRLKKLISRQREVKSHVLAFQSALGIEEAAAEDISGGEERSGGCERCGDIPGRSRDQSKQKGSLISEPEMNDHSQLELQGNADMATSSSSGEADESDSEQSTEDDASEEAIFKFLEAERSEASVNARDAFKIDLTTLPRDYDSLFVVHCKLLYALQHTNLLIGCKYPTRHKKRGYTGNDHNLKTKRTRKCSLLRSEVKAEDVVIPEDALGSTLYNPFGQLDGLAVQLNPTFTEIPRDVYEPEQAGFMMDHPVYPANDTEFNDEYDFFSGQISLS